MSLSEMKRTTRSNTEPWRGGEYFSANGRKFYERLMAYDCRQAGMIMIAETISLGILSLPSVLAAVGILPSVEQNPPISTYADEKRLSEVSYL